MLLLPQTHPNWFIGLHLSGRGELLFHRDGQRRLHDGETPKQRHKRMEGARRRQSGGRAFRQRDKKCKGLEVGACLVCVQRTERRWVHSELSWKEECWRGAQGEGGWVPGDLWAVLWICLLLWERKSLKGLSWSTILKDYSCCCMDNALQEKKGRCREIR